MNRTNITHFDGLDIEEIDFRYNLPQHNGKIAYLSVIFVVSLVSNIILIVQQLHKIRKPVSNQSKSLPYMLINLAVANLVSTFSTILVHAVWFGFTWWYAGNFMCKLVMFLRGLEHFVRPYSVVGMLMAYIAERVTKKDGKTTAVFFILPAWVIGCLLSLPMFFLFEARGQQFPQCFHYNNSLLIILMVTQLMSTVAFGLLCPCILSSVLSCVLCCIGKKGKDSEAVASNKIHYNSSTQECTHDKTPLDAPTQQEHIKPNHLPLVINIIFFILSLLFLLFIISAFIDIVPVLFNHMMWLYFTGTSSVAVTAVVAILGSLERFPKCRSFEGFKFKRMISDV